MSDPQTPAPAAEKPPAPQMTPAECAQQLKERFPALFAGPAKPLKLRIQADIQQRAPGLFTKPVLSAFLRRHTGSTSYLIALTKAPHRFDLDGQPAGEISEEHRQAAADELARRRANHEARRAEEEQARRQRAQLLRDFERTTLTPANFCALKGIPAEELENVLALARQEAAERPQPPRHDDRRPPRGGHEARPGRNDRPDRHARGNHAGEGARNGPRGPKPGPRRPPGTKPEGPQQG